MAAHKVVVEGSSVTAAQLKDLFRQIEDGSLNGSHFQAFLEHRDPFGSIAMQDSLPDINWMRVYEQLGMADDLLKLCSDESKIQGLEGLWAVPVLPGVTPNRIIKVFRKLGVKVVTYVNNLDTDVLTNDRDPFVTGGCIVRFKRTIEADPENANQSANDRKQKKAIDITLTERLLLELGYFLATGKHLDIENWTLCAGSRSSDGNVPYVGWYADDQALCVNWCHPGGRYSNLRARAAVAAEQA